MSGRRLSARAAIFPTYPSGLRLRCSTSWRLGPTTLSYYGDQVHLDLLRSEFPEFPIMAQPLSIVTVRYRDCGYSLEPLSAFRNLTGLDVIGYRDSTLGTLRGLEHLRYLRILHLPKVSDLSDLGTLPSLEVLRLATLPSWDASGRVTRVDSLEPLTCFRI